MERRICGIFMPALVLAMFGYTAHAEIFDADRGGTNYSIYEESIISKNVLIEFQNLYIKNSLTLENYGTIASRIIIDSEKTLFLKNSGTISGDIVLENGADLVLVVNDEDDLQSVKVSKSPMILRGVDQGAPLSSFSVLADGAADLDFSGLVDVSENADRLVIKDSVIHFSPGQRSSVPVQLLGEVVFNLGDAEFKDGDVLLSDVSGEGALFIRANTGRLFFAKAEMHMDDVVLRLVRNTNYAEIFRDARGSSLDNARVSGAKAKLLAKMDLAKTESELAEIMNESVMFNPIKLMTPIKLMAKSDQAGIKVFDTMGGDAMTIFGNGLSLHSIGAGIEFAQDDFSFGLSAYGGEFSAGNLENFSGKMYGGAVRASLNKKLFYANASFGLSFTDLSTDGIYNGSSVPVYDTNGLAGYGALEFGARVGEPTGLYASPFARGRIFSAKVLHERETEFAAGIGAKVGYRESVIGIETDYGLFAVAETDGMQVGARMEIFSEGDDISINLDASAIQYESDWFYKIGAGVKIGF